MYSEKSTNIFKNLTIFLRLLISSKNVKFAHHVQPFFQDQISPGRPIIFYVLFKREKSPFFFIFKRKVQHRVKFTSTKQTASWVLSFVVFYGWLFLQIKTCGFKMSHRAQQWAEPVKFFYNFWLYWRFIFHSKILIFILF